MTAGKLLERVSLRSPPEHAAALAELELLHFEQDLLRARLSEQEDLDQHLSHLQSALDAAAAEIVELRFNLQAEQRKCEQLEEDIREARQSSVARLEQVEAERCRSQEALTAATEEIARLKQERQGLLAAGATAGEAREELATALAQLRDQQQHLSDRLTAAETGQRAAVALGDRLQAEKAVLETERDTLELDLLGVLAKLGRYPQGALLRFVPGYRRLRARYGNKLSAG